ncbi:uncharacterized protein LOC121382204 [Gigantopelta aegis]|uniref:uncharacterized protein LOC121382204 n=1 Tax=Gigantopelta aegis TaxID=1735272 RepID=UPI001B889C43|nr:uncharacterized protein LOC121382204 [Gigantopelta aegis]
MDEMDEVTKIADDVGSKKKPKLKRIVKKKPKFHLNSSINSSVYAKNITMHKNSIMNTSVVKATLRANNKALAQSLEKVRLDLRMANEIIMMEKKEKQELQQRVATLSRVAGLKDEQFEIEANRRIEAKLQHLKSLLHQTSQHLFDGGMCIQQAMEDCFSSRLSNGSEPRGSSVGFIASDDDRSPMPSRSKREVVYRPSLMNSSPPSREDVSSTAEKDLDTVETDSVSRVEMSMILEQSMINASPLRCLASSLPAVLESGVNESVTGIIAKEKRDYGIPKRVLKSDHKQMTDTSSKQDVHKADMEMVVPRSSDVLKETVEQMELTTNAETAVKIADTLCTDKRNAQESIVKNPTPLTDGETQQKLRRGTFILSSPTCHATVSGTEKNIDRRGTFILPASTAETTDDNKKLSCNTASVDVPNNKRETFCVRKVRSNGNDAKHLESDERGIDTSETLCDDQSVFKQPNTVVSQSVCSDEGVFKQPNAFSVSKAPCKGKSSTKLPIASATFQPSLNDKAIFKQPSVVSDECSVGNGPDGADENTIYFNSDMELTGVIDVTALSQSNSEMNNPAEKKSKPPVCLRLSKPGKITFAASRKENDGTRKIIPSKLPSKVRSKSKLRLLKQAIATDMSNPKNIFDFHDKTPSHLQEKSSVFDVSLNESVTATQTTVDGYKERLLKLKAKATSRKSSDAETKATHINSKSKDSEGVSRITIEDGSQNDDDNKSKEKVKKLRTKKKVQIEALEDVEKPENDGSSSRKSTVKVSLTGTEETDGGGLQSGSQKNSNQTHTKDSADDTERNGDSDPPVKERSRKSQTKTKTQTVESTDDTSHTEVSSSNRKSSHKNSLSEQALSGDMLDSNDKCVSEEDKAGSRYNTKDGNKELITRKPQATKPATSLTVATVKLLSDACPVYSLPLKGSPALKDSSQSVSKRRKSTAESSKATGGDTRRTRSRSRKRVDYTEVSSDEEFQSSSAVRPKQSPEKKRRPRSRGRTLKKSLSKVRSESGTMVDGSDVESAQSERVNDECGEQNTELHVKSRSNLSRVDIESSSTCKQPGTETGGTEIMLLPDPEVCSSPLKDGPGRLRNRSRSLHSLVTRRTRSQSRKRAVPLEHTLSDEDTDNSSQPGNVDASPQGPAADRSKARSHGRSRRKKSLTRGGVRVNDDNTSSQNEESSEVVNTTDSEQNNRPRTVTDTESGKTDELVTDELKMSVPFTSSVYSLPLKGSPEGSVGSTASGRRSRGCGAVSRSASRSRKKSHVDEAYRSRSRSGKHAVPPQTTDTTSDDESSKCSQPSSVAGSPKGAEKSKARSRGRSVKRRSLSKTRSKSKKRLVSDTKGNDASLETTLTSVCGGVEESACSEAEGNKSKENKRRPKAYVIKKKPEALACRKTTSKESQEILAKHSDSFAKKRSVMNFLTVLDKDENSNTDSLSNSDSPGNKVKTKGVADTSDRQKNVKMTAVKGSKKAKQSLDSPSKCMKQPSRGVPFRWTPQVSPRATVSLRVSPRATASLRVSPRATASPQAGETHKDSSSGIRDNQVRQSSSLEILKRKLAQMKNHTNEENNSENNEDAKRSRRAAAVVVNYKMPSLTVKMRQGDRGTSSLYDGVSKSVFKISPTKTGVTVQHKPMVDVTNTS